MDYVQCQFSKTFLAKNASCKLTFLNRTQKAFTLKIISLLKTTTSEQVIHYQLFYRYRTGWRIFLVNFKDNYCDYVKNENVKSKVLNLIIPIMKTYSNVNLTCPYIGPFIIDKMPLNAAIFENPFVPVGKYYLNITLSYEGDLILSMQFYFTVPEGRSIENDGLGR